MIYYSTGKSRYLAAKGRRVEVNEQTGNRLVEKGCLVVSIDDLTASKIVEDVVVEQAPIVEDVVVDIKPEKAEKPKKKGNPNWGKKKVK